MSDKAKTEAKPEPEESEAKKEESDVKKDESKEDEAKPEESKEDAQPERKDEAEVVGTTVGEENPSDSATKAEVKEAIGTRASVLDLARGEVNDEDLTTLEAAINSLDFATRKATEDVIGRLEALHTRLGSLVEQIRKGERAPEPEREPLSEEALLIVQNLIDQGVSAGERGNLEEARGYLEEAIQLSPDGIDCLFNLGVVYGLLAHHNIAKAEFYDNYVRDEVFIERAQICYDHLIELEPDHLPSLNNLATLYSIRDNREQAIPLLERIVELDPKSDGEKSLVKRAREQLREIGTA